MKKYLSVIAAVFLFFTLQSCKKEKTSWEKIQESNSGVVTAKLNGEDWTGQIVTGYDNSTQRFSISVHQYTGEIQTEILSMRNIYFAKPVNRAYDYFTLNGKQDSTMANFSLVDDDVIFSSYFASGDSGAINRIYVDNYDSAKRIVDGRFSFNLYLREGDVAARNWPDTLRFTDGKFHLTIKK